MANTLSITADLNRTRVFQCPNCKQTIDTRAEQCRFCSAPIDAATAERAAALMERVNQACSDASYLRIALVCGLVFLAMTFVPFMGLLGIVGYYFLLIAIPVWTIRWWVRFGRLKAEDGDFRKARKTMLLLALPVSILLLLWAANMISGYLRPIAR
jgi:hypothetical protein